MNYRKTLFIEKFSIARDPIKRDRFEHHVDFNVTQPTVVPGLNETAEEMIGDRLRENRIVSIAPGSPDIAGKQLRSLHPYLFFVGKAYRRIGAIGL